MKKNENGFGIGAVFVALCLAGVIGFTGWYVWSNKDKGTSKVVDSIQKKDEQSPAETTADKPISEDWKEYQSGRGGFSVALADGLTGYRVMNSDWFIFKVFSETDTPAAIQDIEGYGSDSFHPVSISQDQSANGWIPEGEPNVQESAFVTASGLSGVKRIYKQPYDQPCAGLGCNLGSTVTLYTFQDANAGAMIQFVYLRRVVNEDTKRIYGIEADDPDLTDRVEAMVKTLVVK